MAKRHPAAPKAPESTSDVPAEATQDPVQALQEPNEPAAPEAPVEQAVSLVKMNRDDDGAGGPTSADVHPLEVDNMIAGNWRVAE